jgi:mono/diheme cytochrome c family protein
MGRHAEGIARARGMKFRTLTIALVIGACSRKATPERQATITFRGDAARSLDSVAMRDVAGVSDIEAFDPYYQRKKHFRGYELAKVVVKALDMPLDALKRSYFVLRARDGYEVPISGERLLEPGAFIAFEDVDAPAWEPIGPQRANPSPFYLVWKEPHQTSLEMYPRPWQLEAIDRVSFDRVYPHIAPPKGAATAVVQGFSIFIDTCIRCHAMNREGGRVGPDLNVPKSIVEYRPAFQIKAYVRDPMAFRYGNMPAHPHLSDESLDALVSYFAEMSHHKHDDRSVSKGP